MKIAVIGRSELLFETVELLRQAGHDIVCVITAKAAPEYKKTESDFECLAKELGVPFAITSTIKSQYDLLVKTEPQIAVSVNYSGVIPKVITDLFPLGILNAHGGDLPRYRGNACQAWAIINGEEKVGLCVHRMIGGELDNGDIIARDYLSIDRATKVTVIWSWMQNRIPRLYLHAIEKLKENPQYILEEQSKNPTDSLRCYSRTPEDGRIDWTASNLKILRLINASNLPYSGAFCYLNDQKLIVWDAKLGESQENFCAIPGQVIFIDQGVVGVACGKGILHLHEIEYEGAICEPNVLIKSTRLRLK
jgi:methionyl-tRNA formyltransferase